tara:strand:+ start:4222 stop:4956 length:735 start_codon:yes stop_codon:yes gene_type:complete
MQNERIIFKKVPKKEELDILVKLLLNKWNNKFSFENMYECFEKELLSSDIEIEERELYCLKKSVNIILNDLYSSTASHLITNATRYLKTEYSIDLCKKISYLSELLIGGNDVIENKRIVLCLSVMLMLKMLNIELKKLNNMSNNRLKCYYGNYNKIISKIQSDINENIYWSCFPLDLSGYFNETIIVVQYYINVNEKIDETEYLNMMNVLLRNMRINKMIIISGEYPKGFLLESLNKENIFEIV